MLDDFKRTNPDWENLESVLIIAKVETFIDLETCINAFPECISHPNITSYKEFALEILSNVDDEISRSKEELEEIGVKALSNENCLFTDGGLLMDILATVDSTKDMETMGKELYFHEALSCPTEELQQLNGQKSFHFLPS